MKKLKLFFLFFTLLYLLAACGGGSSTEDSKDEASETSEESTSETTLTDNGDDDSGIDEIGGIQLSDKLVKNYIAFIEDVKANDPEFDNENPLANMAKAQSYLKKHGFNNITEFSMVNMKVVSATTSLVTKEQGLAEKAATNYKEQLAELEKQLADDKIPAEAKTQIKETIKMLKENEKTVTLENLETQLKQGYGGVSDEEMQVIKNNYPALKKVLNIKE